MTQPVEEKDWKECGSKRGKAENEKGEGRADLGSDASDKLPKAWNLSVSLPDTSPAYWSSLFSLSSPGLVQTHWVFLFLEHLPLSHLRFFTGWVPFVWTPSSFSAPIRDRPPLSADIFNLNLNISSWKAFPELPWTNWDSRFFLLIIPFSVQPFSQSAGKPVFEWFLCLFFCLFVFFLLEGFLAMPMACGSSRARDLTHATAMTMPGP